MRPEMLRARGPGPERIEQRIALIGRQFGNIGVGAPSQIQHRPAGFGMGADQRMNRTGDIVAITKLLFEPFAGFASRIVRGIVFAGERRDTALQIVRQRVIGGIHVTEAGIAASLWRFQRIEKARHRRIVDIGHVCVPDQLGITEPADGLPVLDHIGNDREMRQLRDIGFSGHRDRREIEIAQPGAEIEKRRIGKSLAAKHQHQMILPRLKKGPKRRVAHIGEVDTRHLRTQRIGNPSDIDFCGRHRNLPKTHAILSRIVRVV